MITTKILTASELSSLLQHVQLQQNQYVFYFIKSEDVLQLMCKKPNGDSVAIFNSSTVNQKYYKASVQDVHPSGSDYTIINQSYTANGVTDVRYIIEGEPNLYSIANGISSVDSNLEIGSFTYYIDSKNNTYLFYIYDGSQWLPIYVQGGLGDHITDYHNPHRVTKEQIGLSKVGNIHQITESQYVSHVSAHNPHRVTKEQIGLSNVENIKQLSLLDYVNHKNARNPHGITKVHIGLDRVLQNVIQIPYDEFLHEHIEARNPHRVTLQQLGLDKIDVNALQGQTTQKEFQEHIQSKTAHHITAIDVGLENVRNARQSDHQVVSNHINIDRNPHGITKTDVGLNKVRNVQQANYNDYQEHIINHNNPHGITKTDVGLNKVRNVQQVSVEAFELHINDRNPHQVTKEQIGLGNVNNVISVNQTDYNLHINNHNNPHQVTVDNILGVDRIGISLLNLVPQSEFLKHVSRTDNPHRITKADIPGLATIENINQLSLNDYKAHITAINPHRITKADIGLSLVDNTSIENKPISSTFRIAAKRKYLKSLMTENDPIKRQKIMEENYGISYSPYIIDKKFATDGTVLTDDNKPTTFDLTDINNQGKFIRLEKAATTAISSVIGHEEELNDWYWYIADGKVQRLLCDKEQIVADPDTIIQQLFPNGRNIFFRNVDFYKDKTVTPIVRGVFSINHTILEELIYYYTFCNSLSNCTATVAGMDYNTASYNGVNFGGTYGTALTYPLGNWYFIDKNQNEVLVPFRVIVRQGSLGLKFVVFSLPSDSITVAYSREGNKNYEPSIPAKRSYSEEGISVIKVLINDEISEDQYFKFVIPQNTTGKPRDIKINLYQGDRPRSCINVRQEG